jgi:hypothetical protein
MVAIDISEEQYRIMNGMRGEIRTGRRVAPDPMKNVVQKLLDAYVPPGKD